MQAASLTLSTTIQDWSGYKPLPNLPISAKKNDFDEAIGSLMEEKTTLKETTEAFETEINQNKEWIRAAVNILSSRINTSIPPAIAGFSCLALSASVNYASPILTIIEIVGGVLMLPPVANAMSAKVQDMVLVEPVRQTVSRLEHDVAILKALGQNCTLQNKEPKDLPLSIIHQMGLSIRNRQKIKTE